MITEEIQNKIDEILDNFDFVKVHKVMEHLDWKWSTENGVRIPTIQELRVEARGLLKSTIKENISCISTGGFHAEKITDETGTSLALRFVIEEIFVE